MGEPSQGYVPIRWRRIGLRWLLQAFAALAIFAVTLVLARVALEIFPLGMVALFAVLAITILLALGLAISIHELGHALAAVLLGDRRDFIVQRLTLNPLPHLDPVGCIMVISGQPGWSQLVPISGRELRFGRIGWLTVIIAGQGASLAAAWVAGAFLEVAPDLTFAQFFLHFCLMLVVINLLPLPPLDGYYLVFGLMPRPVRERWVRAWDPLERYGPLLLVAILLLTTYVPIAPINPRLVLQAATDFVAGLLGTDDIVRWISSR
ncbi:MAG: site-2 protease family protein [Chloroflexi bacterium]|nr:site-2 protease family protein [Chloroflexota bacterium]